MKLFLCIVLFIYKLSLICTVSTSDILSNQSKCSNERTVLEGTKLKRRQVYFRSPLLFPHANLPSANFSVSTKVQENRKNERDGSYKPTHLQRQHNVVSFHSHDALSGQVVTMENDSVKAQRQGEKNNSGSRSEPLGGKARGTTLSSVWDRVSDGGSMGDFAEGNISHDEVTEEPCMSYTLDSGSGSRMIQGNGYDYTDGDNLWSRKWNAPPVDYYRCGKYTCHNSTNGVTSYANCQYHLLRQIPDYRSENISEINLYHNLVNLELLESVILHYGILNISSNAIKEPPNCTNKRFLILMISFSIGFVFVIALGVWTFRNRWRLHYFRNIIIARFFGYHPKNGDEDQHYAYDAHFLYSKEDKEFVLGDCLRELEVKRNHKLCIEDRDFLLGTFMTCSITSAVCSSRWSVPLISPDFWANEWCEYGVQMASMESIHKHRNVLHFLIYKPTPVETMPVNLIKLLKENTFCEYPPVGCDENVKQAFWDELSRTIGHVQPKCNEDGNR